MQYSVHGNCSETFAVSAVGTTSCRFWGTIRVLRLEAVWLGKPGVTAHLGCGSDLSAHCDFSHHYSWQNNWGCSCKQAALSWIIAADCAVCYLHIRILEVKNNLKCYTGVKPSSKTSLFLYRYLFSPASAAAFWGFTANCSLTGICKLLWLLGQSEKLCATGNCYSADQSYCLSASLIWWRKESKLGNYLFGLSYKIGITIIIKGALRLTKYFWST